MPEDGVLEKRPQVLRMLLKRGPVNARLDIDSGGGHSHRPSIERTDKRLGAKPKVLEARLRLEAGRILGANGEEQLIPENTIEVGERREVKHEPAGVEVVNEGLIEFFEQRDHFRNERRLLSEDAGCRRLRGSQEHIREVTVAKRAREKGRTRMQQTSGTGQAWLSRNLATASASSMFSGAIFPPPEWADMIIPASSVACRRRAARSESA